MAIYDGAKALDAQFRAPREGSYEQQAGRISMGVNARELNQVRRTNAGLGVPQYNPPPKARGKRGGKRKLPRRERSFQARPTPGRHQTQDQVSKRRQLYNQLRNHHRGLAHLWAQAASLAHGRSREAFAKGEPAAALFEAGLLAEAESAYHLRQASALDDAMRATY